MNDKGWLILIISVVILCIIVIITGAVVPSQLRTPCGTCQPVNCPMPVLEQPVVPPIVEHDNARSDLPDLPPDPDVVIDPHDGLPVDQIKPGRAPYSMRTRTTPGAWQPGRTLRYTNGDGERHEAMLDQRGGFVKYTGGNWRRTPALDIHDWSGRPRTLTYEPGRFKIDGKHEYSFQYKDGVMRKEGMITN